MEDLEKDLPDLDNRHIYLMGGTDKFVLGLGGLVSGGRLIKRSKRDVRVREVRQIDLCHPVLPVS